ncbi:proton-coupled folate transporter-like [Lingula anatina]|uniref:Proton-coupled folate transporter-like n=1 Tax=Lingula anatina TaxID=7574 RepID=A0A1S3K9X4_LINAN|nr:proton-coupled folate transporter-like [Lingula anatina]|eukprot:XP_013419249.1 proton-coupled folate transporter-like [Lingula anatina]
MGESMLEPTVKLYMYQGLCLDEFPNSTICRALQRHPAEEDYIQAKSANYLMYYKILLNLPAIFLGLFCGAWSDRIGRKIPIMLPCIGSTLAVCLYILSDENENSVAYILCGTTVNGIFGKSAIITMAVHSYVTDVSDSEARTRRLGGLLAMNFFGLFAGSLTAGFMLGMFSFDVVFCCVAVINALVVLMTVFCLKESVEDSVIESALAASPFKLSHITESLSVMCKPREGNKRCHLILFFITIVVNQACKAGEVDITLLFVKHRPFHWTKAQYGYLLALDYASLGLFLMVILPILSGVLGMKDLTLVKIALTFKVCRLVFMAFNTETWLIYVSVVIASVSGMIVSGLKSQMSKAVNHEDVGKAFSILSVGETTANLVGAIVFTNFYAATVDIFAGFTFCFEATIHLVLLALIFWLARDLNHDEQASPVLGKYGALVSPESYDKFPMGLDVIEEVSSPSSSSETSNALPLQDDLCDTSDGEMVD